MCIDVKPSNILINRAGQVKLCDFGIAGELVNSFCQTDIGCKPYLAVSGWSSVCVCSPYSFLSLSLSLSLSLYLTHTLCSRRGSILWCWEPSMTRDLMYGAMASPWSVPYYLSLFLCHFSLFRHSSLIPPPCPIPIPPCPIPIPPLSLLPVLYPFLPVLYPFLPRPLQYELAVGQFPYPVWKNMFEQLKSVVDGEAPRVPANLSLSPEFTDYLHLWWVYINYTASQYYPTPLFYCIGSTTLTLGNHGLPPIAQECY